jgi:hypothetical protein
MSNRSNHYSEMLSLTSRTSEIYTSSTTSLFSSSSASYSQSLCSPCPPLPTTTSTATNSGNPSPIQANLHGNHNCFRHPHFLTHLHKHAGLDLNLQNAGVLLQRESGAVVQEG